MFRRGPVANLRKHKRRKVGHICKYYCTADCADQWAMWAKFKAKKSAIKGMD